MRDLDLWRRLATGSVEPGEIIALSIQSLTRRAPYLGGLVALAQHANASLRAAALDALAGVRGVPGVRVLVAALDDDEPTVRAAALRALRTTSLDAPHRFVHALFHERLDVRRRALTEVPPNATGLAVHLRADAACADLAATIPFSGSFELALDLHAQGAFTDGELADQLARARGHVQHTLQADETNLHTRQFLRAIIGAEAYGEPLAAIMQFAVSDLVVFGRITACVQELGWTTLPAPVQGAYLALVPTTIASPEFTAEHVPAAIAGLTRWVGPGMPGFAAHLRPSVPELQRLLALPFVRSDLALAAAIASHLPAKRLKTLAKSVGQTSILASLRASDHGWREILNLPAEAPNLELQWLAMLADSPRYAPLATTALLRFAPKRREKLVEVLQHHEDILVELSTRPLTLDVDTVGELVETVASHLNFTVVGTAMGRILESTGAALALVLVRKLEPRGLGVAVGAVTDAQALRLINLLDAEPVPRSRELAVALAWKARTEPAIAAWVQRIVQPEPPAPVVAAPLETGQRELTSKERATIVSASAGELPTALRPALSTSVTGLTAALRERSAAISLEACVALLACADPLPEVARQLDRFARVDATFDTGLSEATSAWWLRQRDIAVLAHARLWRWEQHGFALIAWLERAGGLQAALEIADQLPGRLAARTLWHGLAEAVALMRYRDRPAFERHATIATARYCSERVDRDIGRAAARIILHAVEGRRVPLAEVRAELLERTPDATAETREQLARIIRLDGMPEPPRIVLPPPPASIVEQIRACRDLDKLVEWCHEPSPAIVQEAALALVMLGPDGQRRLAELLRDPDKLLAPLPVVQTVILWDAPAALAIVRELATSGTLLNAWQYHLSLALHVLGDAGQLERALAAACAPDQPWFRRADWDTLVAHADPHRCALALVEAPHHHAYKRSVDLLLAQPAEDTEVAAALRRFLEIDADRPIELRRTVARNLAYGRGDFTGIPIILEELIDTKGEVPHAVLPHALSTPLAAGIVDAGLVGGHPCCTERRMVRVLSDLRTFARLDEDTNRTLCTRMLEEATTTAARQEAVPFVVSAATTDQRVTQVAEVFAWGVRRGLELSGRILRMHLTAKEADLGHTYLDGNQVYVSALPMLRGEPHGRDIVEGLVLHEIGHHVYHASERDRALWKEAHGVGLGHLLNLIADEHLERNLRAINGDYGDRLKRLDAYAFQHAPQEINVPYLLGSLRAHAARALITTPLDVAFDEDSVRMRRGAVLAELDKAGHLVARFARALRMGLGNRHQDPVIEQALALCRDLRKQEMPGLYGVTRQLARLFGGATALAKVFGGPEGLTFGERDGEVFGAGIDDDILQREVERILDPKRGKKSGRVGPADRLQINVNPDAEFDRIHDVRKVRGNQDEHGKLAHEVARHSRRLGMLLDELGLRWEPARARIQGRSIDKTRLRPLVTRGDPRILQARTPVRRTDLFLGTVIDCSGSMTAGNNLERARKFAILIAEAVKPLRGVDARFWGFTDSTIYDAGDAQDCHVTGLVSDGGNNDAAALFHAAAAAMASKRKAKVVVMISDGLPTECSVAALRTLATTLTKRKGVVCAQVAVRPIEEDCFQHHVLLDDAQVDVSVAKFGRLIGDLARRVLGS